MFRTTMQSKEGESYEKENPVDVTSSLFEAFTNGLFRVVLPQLKEECPAEARKILRARLKGGRNDLEIGFWAPFSGYYDIKDFICYLNKKAFSAKKIAAHFSFSLDLIMANKDVDLEKRREIIGKFWELCEKDFGIIVRKNEKIEL